MTSSAVSGFSTVLVWNYHRLLELNNIGGPSQSMSPIDVTSHDSDDGFREFIAGLRDGGDISIEGNLILSDANGQIAAHTDMQAGTSRTAWIVLPMAVGGAWVITGELSAISFSEPMDDKLGISGTLKVSGKPTLLTTQSDGISGLTGIEENGGAALVISPAIAAGTYAYTCTVNTASTYVQLTITAATHTIYAQGTLQTSGVQGGQIALGDAGTDTEIFIMVYESSESPRLYVLTVTRPSP